MELLDMIALMTTWMKSQLSQLSNTLITDQANHKG